MQFEVRLHSVLDRGLELNIFISRMVVCVAISDIVRCTGIDGFLIVNDSKSYEQHCVWMQEVEDGYNLQT